MGANLSKEELLYQSVRNGNHDAVKALRRDGASLEWVDKDGRTPLILTCTRGELLDMAITLLNLGANMNAYKPGPHGGYPLHFAAKRGLDKTVTLLLSRGANPSAINDDGQTPLEMARSRGHAAVVRILEERLCIFNGLLRELSGLKVVESLAPKFFTKKVWAVVLPSKTSSVYELAIYEAPKVCLWSGVNETLLHPAGPCNVAQPRTLISLVKTEIQGPNFNLKDPMLQIVDKTHKRTYKFFPENKGDKTQLENFYKACKGHVHDENGNNVLYPHDENVPPSAQTTGFQQGNLSQVHPDSHVYPQKHAVLQSVSVASSAKTHVLQSVSTSSASMNTTSGEENMDILDEDIALELALNESIRTAKEEGIPISPHPPYSTYKTSCSVSCVNGKGYERWDTKTSWECTSPEPSDAYQQCMQQRAASPSAPPLPPAECSYGSVNSENKSSGTCIICWDAPAEGACIPCGHMAGCMRCLTEIESNSWGCPVCRGSIDQVIKVYAV